MMLHALRLQFRPQRECVPCSTQPFCAPPELHRPRLAAAQYTRFLAQIPSEFLLFFLLQEQVTATILRLTSHCTGTCLPSDLEQQYFSFTSVLSDIRRNGNLWIPKTLEEPLLFLRDGLGRRAGSTSDSCACHPTTQVKSMGCRRHQGL